MLPLIALVSLVASPAQIASDPLYAGWTNVPNEARARMYWRVFGPAWDKPNIDRQLRLVKSAGLGGVMTYFMYPFALDEPGKWTNQAFNSPEFLGNFKYAVQSTNKLGLRFGVCGSTGWPFGGSKVSVSDSAQMLRKVDCEIKDGIFAPVKGQWFRDWQLDTTPASKIVRRPLRIVAMFRNGKPTQRWTDGPMTLFIEGSTMMQVKRPSYGNEGLVVDHLNADAVTRYLHSTVEPMLQTDPAGVRSIFSDSLEVYRQNWTHDFPEQFKKLRGYDLVPRLLELFDDKSPNAFGLRQDFWRTVAELAEQRYVKTLYDWSHKHGLETELQPYGTPPLPMTSSAYIDMPTGEHYEWKGFNVCRYVASAAHQEGKNLVGSEAWTWGAIPNRLTDSLSDLKLMSDMHFLSGVNDITGVDFPYSPQAAGVPGWLPYYGPSIGENNPQWAVFPDLVSYLNRCSWMLRQGKPAAKVAVYLPVEDGMAKGGTEQLLLDFAVRDHFVTGPATSEFGLKKAMTHRSDLVETLMKQGIGFDGIDFWTVNKLAKPARVDGHAGVSVGSASYRVVILPRIESIDLASLRKLESLCKSGVILVATGVLPSRACGMAGEAADREVQAIVMRLFAEQPSQTYKKVGEATTFFVKEDSELWILRDLDVSQARFQAFSGSATITRRDIEDGEIYFVANPNDVPADYTLQPIPTRNHLELWNPIDGTVRSVQGGRVVNSRLPARGSMIIVARDRPSGAAIAPGGFVSAFGQQLNPSLDENWTLSFVGPDAPPSATIKSPTFWETLPGCDKFSGEGIYRKSFSWQATGSKTTLQLPEVYDAAIVYLNGKRAGAVWLPPYDLDISKFVKTGFNDLEIHVFSSMANRFIGLPDPDIKALRAKYGNRFSAPEEKQLMKGPEHAGIDGPVRIIATVPQGSFHP